MTEKRYQVQRCSRIMRNAEYQPRNSYESLAQAIETAEFLRDEYEPGEYDGRLYTYRIVDLETGQEHYVP